MKAPVDDADIHTLILDFHRRIAGCPPHLRTDYVDEVISLLIRLNRRIGYFQGRLSPDRPVPRLADYAAWGLAVLGLVASAIDTWLAGEMGVFAAVSLFVGVAGFVPGALIVQYRQWERRDAEDELAELERSRQALDDMIRFLDE